MRTGPEGTRDRGGERSQKRVGREIDVGRAPEARYAGGLLGSRGREPAADRHHGDECCDEALHGIGRGKGGATHPPHSAKAALLLRSRAVHPIMLRIANALSFWPGSASLPPISLP